MFPRVELANIPTPLEKMQRLSEHIAGPTYFVKRDDLTGFAGGGNKARQLEYSFGEAIHCGADVILVNPPGVVEQHTHEIPTNPPVSNDASVLKEISIGNSK